MKFLAVLLTLPFILLLNACVVTAPAKAIWNTGKFAGKTVIMTGKGVYQVGKLTVRAADGVLDGTERVLRLTILTSDAAGSIVRSTREINAAALESELAVLERAGNVIEVIVQRVE